MLAVRKILSVGFGQPFAVQVRWCSFESISRKALK